mmetsp:Transcript_35969/g.95465  ORF Transcript_35969/g.95465 Transcript_35969/m.95465 type:complete len:223 (-) Transcript_35969:366-1034(-)
MPSAVKAAFEKVLRVAPGFVQDKVVAGWEGSQCCLHVALDLDATLVCATSPPPCEGDAFVIFKSKSKTTVLKRPGTDEFLAWLARENVRVSVFTTAGEDYAEAVVAKLDPEGAVISRILSRSSCTHKGSGGYVKDLQMLGSDLRRTVLVDNDLRVFAQPDNGIHVDDFSGETTDHELTRVRSIIQELLHVEDVRKVLRGSLKLKQRQSQVSSSYSDFLDQLH